MKYFYHYTSKENWNKIQKSKVLLPRTKIYNAHKKYFSNKTKSIVKFKEYIVGFPEIRHKGWMEYGLWNEIFRLIKCEILLKIKIPDNSKGFVREHMFCSPKSMQQKYGEDVYHLVYSKKISAKDPRIIESLREYWNEVIPLSKYENHFIVPEIWIPEKILLENIKEISFEPILKHLKQVLLTLPIAT